MMKEKIYAVCKQYLHPDRFIFIILILLLAERLILMATLGIDYNLSNDDMGYFNSGIHFANTGIISIYSAHPSAMVMPGMAVTLGILSFLFGEGMGYWLAAKLLWCCLGVLTAYFVYKSVSLFVPKQYGLIMACVFFLPNYVWMDNVILTESPYFCFLTAAIYFTLAMGKFDDRKYFIGYVLATMGALMFRALAISFPFFTAAYLLFMKAHRKTLLRRGLAFAAVLLIFLVPWTIRNYMHFDAFIPLTYGSGNPTLQGTYQGRGYPADEELDYETNVEQVFRIEYADYLDENGLAKNDVQHQFLVLEKDGIKAEYRMGVWWDTHPLLMLITYFIIKPVAMPIKVFYWLDCFGVSLTPLLVIRFVDLLVCCGIFLLALILKKHRAQIVFLAVTYWVYIYMIATTLACDRYAETLMTFRYILIGIGLPMIVDLFKQRVLRKQQDE